MRTLLNRFLNWLQKTPAPVQKTAKDLATERGDPWVEVTSFSLAEDNPDNGEFELDFNDIFVARLVKAGYRGKTDADIVDQWFSTVCSNIATEQFEQWEANYPQQSPRRQDRNKPVAQTKTGN